MKVRPTDTPEMGTVYDELARFLNVTDADGDDTDELSNQFF